MKQKHRLDTLLVERNLIVSRSLAQRYIMAGQVQVDEQVILKPSIVVSPDANIIIEEKQRYVSRGGEKLAAALLEFLVNPEDRICADVGASTGGFTDCLLQHNAEKVYAVDVGKGILDWHLRNNPKVVVLEKTNARYLELLPEPVSLITIDVSFISLKIILPVIMKWLWNQTPREVIALIKPQFEAGKAEATRTKGVIRDSALHERIIEDILAFAQKLGFIVNGLIPSPILGQKGNKEFLAWLSYREQNEK